jgi:hypothetical protein
MSTLIPVEEWQTSNAWMDTVACPANGEIAGAGVSVIIPMTTTSMMDIRLMNGGFEITINHIEQDVCHDFA